MHHHGSHHYGRSERSPKRPRFGSDHEEGRWEGPKRVREDEGKNRRLKAGPCYLKMLVTDIVAGAVIGKGGSTLSQLEQQTEAVVRLSAGGCYFPQTNDRILVLAGHPASASAMIREVLLKMRDVMNHGDNMDRFTVKLALPNTSVSVLIGKGGEVVKDMIARTGARISASPKDKDSANPERIVLVVGGFENVACATEEIFHKIQSDTENLRNHIQLNLMPGQQGQHAPPQDRARYGMPALPPMPPNGPPGPPGPPRPPPPKPVLPTKASFACNYTEALPIRNRYGVSRDVLGSPCVLELDIPEELAADVLGRGGSYLKDIGQRAGASIKMGPREGDLRRMQLRGAMDAVHMAHALVMQRLLQARQEPPRIHEALQSGAYGPRSIESC